MTGYLRSLFLLALLAFAAPALAQERILSYDVDVAVNADASLHVTETIRVLALGYDIKRGIYRDIPLRRLDENGLWDKDGFSIRSIKRDGNAEPYHTEWNGNFLRIYIGDKDVLLPTGQHDYEIAYTVTGQIRYFDGYDEVYWNATGNFWSFAIDKATATVRLPQGARVERQAAYTGGQGVTGTDYSATDIGGSDIRFESTRPFDPNEGLTVAVGFTKGVVAPAGSGDRLTDFLANAGAILFGLSWIAIPIYYWIAWFRVGRDPPGETVIPLFHPPENLSPAALSYVHFKSFRQTGKGVDLAFIASLLQLGVRKLLVIDQDAGGKVTFRKGDLKNVDMQSLAPAERSLYLSLLSGKEYLTLDKANGPLLKRALDGMQSTIRNEYAGKFYKHNWGWFAPGAVLAIVGFVGGLILQNPPDLALASVMPAFFAGLIGSALLLFGWRTWTTPAAGVIRRFAGGFMLLAGAVVIALGVQGALFLTELPLYQAGGLLVMFGLLTMAAMLHLLGAPTFEGAKVLSRIEGFKLYLETAESNRLNMRDAPEMNEQLFERFLPYAAGLGVEEPWSKAFSAHLARVAPDRDPDYRPDWYRGDRWNRQDFARATTASLAAVSSAMASSMPAPKSSSGSSGGGFSGGGGGGGGGGGW